ncbi:hypothetical protein HNY73_005460 [Argiope bruennichi]|uniref:Platelet-derived growth factor (PDGF) family profile domain-containing protein n=1 Tax=Argiope bruennichi TaxID=94029 RepID=A0A8T0FJN7_ARGBR|nr:hypothetical protein HNY73_005460 [Argiope bruennichi]
MVKSNLQYSNNITPRKWMPIDVLFLSMLIEIKNNASQLSICYRLGSTQHDWIPCNELGLPSSKVTQNSQVGRAFMMNVLQLTMRFLVVLVLMIGYNDAQKRIIFRADDENVADEYSPKNVKIPEKLLIQMRDVKDTTEFLNKFVQPYVVVGTESPYIYGRRPMKSPPMPMNAKPGNCEPEEQVVELERPGNGAVFLWPPCVRVRRCGGCCTILKDILSKDNEEA